MALNILWTKRALANLESELDYYGQINSLLAKELTLIIRQSIDTIYRMPAIGRAGKKIGTRELVIEKYPYILAYRVRNDVLEILAIIHQKRKNIRSHY